MPSGTSLLISSEQIKSRISSEKFYTTKSIVLSISTIGATIRVIIAYIRSMSASLFLSVSFIFAAIISHQTQPLQNVYDDDAVLDQNGAANPSVVTIGESDTEEQGKG